MWEAREDAVTDTQLLPSFLGRADGWESAMQCVTIGLGWGHTDGPVHLTIPSRATDRVGAERMHALSIMNVSVCCKRSVEETITDPQTDHYIITVDFGCRHHISWHTSVLPLVPGLALGVC